MAQLLTQSAVLEGFRSEFKHLQRSAMQVGGEARLILDPRVAFQDHLLLYTSDQGFQSTNPLPPPVCLYQWNCCLLQTSIHHPSFFFFFGCARSMWKSPGQGLNLSHKGTTPPFSTFSSLPYQFFLGSYQWSILTSQPQMCPMVLVPQREIKKH